jgi:ABC-type antimicrobial peptide transport system permease subunit
VAQDLFGDQNPVGRKISIGIYTAGRDLEIVGIIPNLRYNDLRDPSNRALFRPLAQMPISDFCTLVEHGPDLDITGAIATIRSVIHDIDKNLPVFNNRTVRTQMDHMLLTERLLAWLSAIYSVLALVLSVIGLYGVMAHTVAMRTHEIGVRMALGAERADILKLVAGQGMKLTLAGIAIGLAGALGLATFLSKMLYGVRAMDPLTIVTASSLLIFVALLAC